MVVDDLNSRSRSLEQSGVPYSPRKTSRSRVAADRRHALGSRLRRKVGAQPALPPPFRCARTVEQSEKDFRTGNGPTEPVSNQFGIEIVGHVPILGVCPRAGRCHRRHALALLSEANKHDFSPDAFDLFFVTSITDEVAEDNAAGGRGGSDDVAAGVPPGAAPGPTRTKSKDRALHRSDEKRVAGFDPRRLAQLASVTDRCRKWTPACRHASMGYPVSDLRHSQIDCKA